MLASLVILLYVPFNIMALSYNSMGIDCMILSASFALNCHKPLQAVLSGGFFMCAVLCCPYPALLYLILLVLLIRNRTGKRRRTASIHSRKTFLLWTAGMAGMALLFAGFVFSRVTVKQMLQVLPLILNDPEHVSRPLRQIVLSYFRSYMRSPVISASYAIAAVLFLTAVLDHNRKNRKHLYFTAVTAVLLYFQGPVY
ncbi:MAG: hypothetical protein K6C08_02625 [Oscillospiraceae bacterium]|nr:hypothetical protein [Oscillospiraceae bacterium]